VSTAIHGVHTNDEGIFFCNDEGTVSFKPFVEVLHQTEPPNTGSQKCQSCGGWIVGSTVWTVDNHLLCSTCAGLHCRSYLIKE